ncbi:hypothetical protein VTG60DRAFT_1257 [Thermothelomyces hinnuleus]
MAIGLIRTRKRAKASVSRFLRHIVIGAAPQMVHLVELPMSDVQNDASRHEDDNLALYKQHRASVPIDDGHLIPFTMMIPEVEYVPPVSQLGWSARGAGTSNDPDLKPRHFKCLYVPDGSSWPPTRSRGKPRGLSAMNAWWQIYTGCVRPTERAGEERAVAII